MVTKKNNNQPETRNNQVSLIALVWLIFVSIHLSAQYYLSGSIIHDLLLPGWLRLAGSSYEMLLLVIYATICAIMLRLPKWWPLTLVKILILSFLIGIYLMSSCLFYLDDLFLGLDSVLIFAHNKLQIIQHPTDLNIKLVTAIPIGLICFICFLQYLLMPLIDRLPSKISRSIDLLFLAAIFGLASIFIYANHASQQQGQRVFAEKEGVSYSLHERFSQSRDQRAGPVAFWLWDLSNQLRRYQFRDQYNKADIHITRPAILPMTSYLQAVDQAHLKKYNVILILIESLRRDSLPSFGGHRNAMPHTNALAEQSTRFTRAYAQSSHSNYADISPVASRYPLYAMRAYYYPKQPSYPRRVLIYDILHAIGYRTAIISSQNETWGGMSNYLQTDGLDTLIHAANYTSKLENKTLAGLQLSTTQIQHDVPMLAGKRAGKIDDKIKRRAICYCQ